MMTIDSEVRSQTSEGRDSQETEGRSQKTEVRIESWEPLTPYPIRIRATEVDFVRKWLWIFGRLAPWIIIGYFIMTLIDLSQPNLSQEDLPEMQPQAYQVVDTSAGQTTSGIVVEPNF